MNDTVRTIKTDERKSVRVKCPEKAGRAEALRRKEKNKIMHSTEPKAEKAEKKPWLYRIIYRIVLKVSPKYTLAGTENLPDEPCVIVGNHCQMYGPLAGEFYMPRPHYIWCVGEMMNRKEVPEYAFRDFWSKKPEGVRWLYRILSHLIAPLAELIFTCAHTIPVYHDARVMTTFRQSMARLQEGADIVIFPESSEPDNAIVTRFHEHFADLARLYFRKTGTALWFVPMYIAPRLNSIHFGKPVRYDPDEEAEAGRKRICASVSDAITGLAKALPRHTVVPYLNIPKDKYPLNTD